MCRAGFVGLFRAAALLDAGLYGESVEALRVYQGARTAGTRSVGDADDSLAGAFLSRLTMGLFGAAWSSGGSEPGGEPGEPQEVGGWTHPLFLQANEREPILGKKFEREGSWSRILGETLQIWGPPPFEEDTTLYHVNWPKLMSDLERDIRATPEPGALRGVGLKRMMPKPIQAPTKGDECVICLQGLRGEPVVRLGCGKSHYLHQSCAAYLHDEPTPSCPICRGPLRGPRGERPLELRAYVGPWRESSQHMSTENSGGDGRSIRRRLVVENQLNSIEAEQPYARAVIQGVAALLLVSGIPRAGGIVREVRRTESGGYTHIAGSGSPSYSISMLMFRLKDLIRSEKKLREEAATVAEFLRMMFVTKCHHDETAATSCCSPLFAARGVPCDVPDNGSTDSKKAATWAKAEWVSKVGSRPISCRSQKLKAAAEACFEKPRKLGRWFQYLVSRAMESIPASPRFRSPIACVEAAAAPASSVAPPETVEAADADGGADGGTATSDTAELVLKRLRSLVLVFSHLMSPLRDWTYDAMDDDEELGLWTLSEGEMVSYLVEVMGNAHIPDDLITSGDQHLPRWFRACPAFYLGAAPEGDDHVGLGVGARGATRAGARGSVERSIAQSGIETELGPEFGPLDRTRRILSANFLYKVTADLLLKVRFFSFKAPPPPPPVDPNAEIPPKLRYQGPPGSNLPVGWR